ncbi:MAG: hypothetical protein KDK63_02585, partial [Chlamydiia bacterium]|nr:hypothetical protein [Chlamydiia bacterium]
MSLPLIIFFERHWDIIPKAVMQKLLPKLEKNGYNTFCIEAPHNISSQEIFKRHHQGLKDDTLLEKQAKSYLRSLQLTKELSEISFTELASLIRLYVSSQHFITVAEKIKQLPASRMLKENFIEASKRSFMIKGIDINSKEYDHLVSLPLSERVVALDQLEIKRIETFSQHLIFLKNEQKKGVIFACGAKHAKSLISELKKYEEEGEVLYYFPHSPSRYDESLDDVAVLLEKNDGVLEGHTYC